MQPSSFVRCKQINKVYSHVHVKALDLLIYLRTLEVSYMYA